MTLPGFEGQRHPGPGKAGLCDICGQEKPHIYHVSFDLGRTWKYACPECSHLAAAQHLLKGAR